MPNRFESAHATGDLVTLRPPQSAICGTVSQATLGESSPNLAGVLATREGCIGINNGIASVDKARVARLTDSLSVLLIQIYPKVMENHSGHGWAEGATYRAMPSTTTFIAKYRPSVGTPSESKVGFASEVTPYLPMRFQMTS